MTTKKATKGFQLELLVDGVPYEVRGQVFEFNAEKRVQLNVNNGTEHVYAWDPETVRLRAIDDDAVLLPDNLEQTISEHLVKTIVLT
jgi:hypothetical protein